MLGGRLFKKSRPRISGILQVQQEGPAGAVLLGPDGGAQVAIAVDTQTGLKKQAQQQQPSALKKQQQQQQQQAVLKDDEDESAVNEMMSQLPVEKRLKFLEAERVRLLHLTRAGSSRRAVKGAVSEDVDETGWTVVTKAFTVVAAICLEASSSSSSCSEDASPATRFAAVSGIRVEERDGELVVHEFYRDEQGNAGPIEASGHVGVEDVLTALHGVPVRSLEDLEDAMDRIRMSGEEGEAENTPPRNQEVGALSAAGARKRAGGAGAPGEVRLEFSRKYAVQPNATRQMTVDELLAHIKLLEGELKFARAEYARLDIGALESLQTMLSDSRAQVHQLMEEMRLLLAREEYYGVRDAELVQRYKSKEAECRSLYNTLVDLKGAIRVFVRVRPPRMSMATAAVAASNVFEAAALSERESVLHFPQDKTIVLSDLEDSEVPEKTWEFDAVFPPRATQRRVYSEVEPLVNCVVDGHNACVFAFGQTGSGKTYTMDGPEKDRGVYFRATESLFESIAKRKRELPETQEIEFTVRVSVIEVYQERVRDLLNPKLAEFAALSSQQQLQEHQREKGALGGTPLPAGADPEAVLCPDTSYIPLSVQPFSLDIMTDATGYVYVPGAEELEARSPAELQELIERGKRHRVVGVTDMNERSSRSHLLLVISVVAVQYDRVAGAGAGAGASARVPRHTSRSKLQLIDLAGSERASAAGGQRLKETGSINKSLAALGDVMAALQQGDAKHIPFRNSKLTSLLRDSLGGNAKTLMMIQVSPLRSQMAETARTLEFAKRVSKISLIKGDKGETQELMRAKRDLVEAQTECERLRVRLSMVSVELDQARLQRDDKTAELERAQRDAASDREAWEASRARLEAELLIARKSQRVEARKETDLRQHREKADFKRMQAENDLAQSELAILRARNTDQRREVTDLQQRVAVLERQLEVAAKQAARAGASALGDDAASVGAASAVLNNPPSASKRNLAAQRSGRASEAWDLDSASQIGPATPSRRPSVLPPASAGAPADAATPSRRTLANSASAKRMGLVPSSSDDSVLPPRPTPASSSARKLKYATMPKKMAASSDADSVGQLYFDEE